GDGHLRMRGVELVSNLGERILEGRAGEHSERHRLVRCGGAVGASTGGEHEGKDEGEDCEKTCGKAGAKLGSARAMGATRQRSCCWHQLCALLFFLSLSAVVNQG